MVKLTLGSKLITGLREWSRKVKTGLGEWSKNVLKVSSPAFHFFCSNQLNLQCGGPSASVHGESHCGHFSIYELSLALWVWEFKGTHPDQ